MPVAGYVLSDGSVVRFELDPGGGFRPAGADGIVGQFEPAVAPLVEGARVIADTVRPMGPARVEVTFGVKVNGSMGWLVAKAATEAHFTVTLTWEPPTRSE
jgi:hypothetical protein